MNPASLPDGKRKRSHSSEDGINEASDPNKHIVLSSDLKRQSHDPDAHTASKPKPGTPEGNDSEDSEKQLQEMRKKVALLQSENRAIQGMLDTTARDMKHEKEASSALKGSLQEAQAELKALKEASTQVVDRSPAESVSEEKEKGADDQFSSLSDSLEEVQAELKASAQESKALLSQLNVANDELSDTKGRLNEAKEQLRSSKKTVDVLSSSLEQALAEVKALKKSSPNLQLREDFVKVHAELKQMKQTAGSLSEAEGQLRASKRTVALLSDSLEQALAELKAVKGAGPNQQLKVELADATAELSALKESSAGQLTEAKDRLRSSTQTVALLSKSLEDALGELKALRETSSANQQLWNDLEKARSVLKTRKESVFERHEERPEDVARAENQVRSAHKTVDQLSHSLQEVLAELSAIKQSAPAPGLLEDRQSEASTELYALKYNKTAGECDESNDPEAPDENDRQCSSLRIQNVPDDNAEKNYSGFESARATFETGKAKEWLPLAKSQVTLLTESLQDARAGLTTMKRSPDNNALKSFEQSFSNQQGPLDQRSLGSGNATRTGNTGVSVQVDRDSIVDTQTALTSNLPGATWFCTSAGKVDRPDDFIQEEAEISLELAGRVIGKGGEILRDLQVRAGVDIVVDQSILPGRTRAIRYRGVRSKVEFAKSLVDLIASGVTDADLPLGEAKRDVIVISSGSTGKVIGRGGDTVREIQNRSNAKIDFDHNLVPGVGSDEKRVILIGSDEALAKAKEMISFLVANPNLDALQSLNVLVDHKLRTGDQWGSGPPYPGLPNRGSAMTDDMFSPGATPSGSQAYLKNEAENMKKQAGKRTELLLCNKQFMGRIIGSRGAVIKDLQKRSGTQIQIKQDVPQGADCEIRITGVPDGIEMAKQMIQQIIDTGANRLFTVGPTRSRERNSSSMAADSSKVQPQTTEYGSQALSFGSDNQAASLQFHPSQQHGIFEKQPPPPPPSEWKSSTTPEGLVYYWNERTGESQWAKPPGMP